MNPLKKDKALAFNNEILPSSSITGLFTGLSVEILDNDDIKKLHESGSWGEGSLSRSAPAVVRSLTAGEPTKISPQQYQKRLEWQQKYGTGNTDDLVKVVYKPAVIQRGAVLEYEISAVLPNPFAVNETLVLFFEEAFFLSYVERLTVLSFDGSLICNDHLWLKFCRLKHNFIECFVAYLYLKNKNWVIKPGIKFGGHFCKFCGMKMNCILI